MREKKGEQEEEEEEAFSRKISESLPHGPVLNNSAFPEVPFPESLLQVSLCTKEPTHYFTSPLP